MTRIRWEQKLKVSSKEAVAGVVLEDLDLIEPKFVFVVVSYGI